jgi:hypothetical protein
MKRTILAVLTANLVILGCARPETVSAPPPVNPPSTAWYSPRNWFKRLDTKAAHKTPEYTAHADDPQDLRPK